MTVKEIVSFVSDKAKTFRCLKEDEYNACDAIDEYILSNITNAAYIQQTDLTSAKNIDMYTDAVYDRDGKIITVVRVQRKENRKWIVYSVDLFYND